MSFLLLEALGLKKAFAGVPILDIKQFRVYAGDRIGFVGANGSGKSTLLSILANELSPDEGTVSLFCNTAYIRQFEIETALNENGVKIHALKLFGVRDKSAGGKVSGGEAARLKIAKAFDSERRLIFADEPTSNLDLEGVERFTEALLKLESFIIISHDRDLLNRCCNKIITVENLDIAGYEGNFDDYKRQAEARAERARFEYEKYTDEKKRLENVYKDKKSKAARVVKKPKGMSSSEAKQRSLVNTSRSYSGKQRNFENAAKNVQKRIDRMEVKERPSEAPRMKLDFSLTDPPANKIVISGKGINFSYALQAAGDAAKYVLSQAPSSHTDAEIFQDASFEIKNAARVAIQGANGSGKTTLFNLIHGRHESIYTVPKARVGYFRQGFENLDMKATVLQNAMSASVQKESAVRSVLARLLFTRNSVGKPAGVLSGGERIKLCLAMLLVSGCNVLMLDEPTNYLDMPSVEVLQSILCEYEGTMLFVSHDRSFTEAVATETLTVRNKKILKC